MSGIHLSEKVQGIKPSAIREVLAKVEDAKKKGISLTNFSIGRPDFDTPDHIKQAAKDALDRGFVHYTTSAGIPELREAVCNRLLEDFQLAVDPGEVIVTSGATEAIYIALQSVLHPGDEVLVPEPMYVYYTGWSFLSGARCLPIPLDDRDGYLLTVDKLAACITEKTRVLILNSPNNPTGQVYPEEDLLAIADLAARHDILVISDDIYSHMVYDGLEYFPIARVPGMKDRTLIIGSFSKSYAMDGWRVGFLVAPQPVISGAIKMHQHIVSCPNAFVQAGALAALRDSQECVHKMVHEFDRRRKLLIECLDELDWPCVRPRGAFYAFPSIEKYGMSAIEFTDFLLARAQVAVVPGEAFGASGAGHIRIAYSTAYDDIEQGMERVMKAVKTLGG